MPEDPPAESGTPEDAAPQRRPRPLLRRAEPLCGDSPEHSPLQAEPAIEAERKRQEKLWLITAAADRVIAGLTREMVKAQERGDRSVESVLRRRIREAIDARDLACRCLDNPAVETAESSRVPETGRDGKEERLREGKGGEMLSQGTIESPLPQRTRFVLQSLRVGQTLNRN